MKSTDNQRKITKVQMYIHLVLAIAWVLMIPIAIFFGWIASIVFVSAISIYANFAGHLAAYEAARSECLSEDRSNGQE